MARSSIGPKQDGCIAVTPLFCFTLDTEPDNLWANKPDLGFEHFRQLPAFHRDLVDAGAKPTYLTTSEVVESRIGRAAIEDCMADGDCEIGAHFHSWTRPWPFEVPELGTPPLHAMAHQLGPAVERQMLEVTCDSLARTVGIEPRSFRGGRWSLGAETGRSLAKSGIIVDSTVTPGLSWKDARSPLLDGPDYRSATRQPFWLRDAADPPKNGAGAGVLEIPVGTAFFPGWSKHLLRSTFCQKAVSKLGRMAGMRWGHRWLRPTKFSTDDMRAVMTSMKHAKLPVWVFMIHSSEIAPCVPLPTEQAVEAFRRRCIDGVRAAVDLGAKGVTLEEAAKRVIEHDVALTSSENRAFLPA